MTTHGLFKALSNIYEKPSASNKVDLIRLLFATRLKEGDCLTDHVNEFNSILSRLSSVDIKFDDELQALLLISSLHDSWSGLSGSGKMNFEGVRDLILGEDIRRRNSGESSGSLLSIKSRGRRYKRGQNQGRSILKSQKRGQSKDRKEIVCWNCHKKGHFINQCTASAALKGKKKEDNSANTIEEVVNDDALICCIECLVESWVMDSGASFHATPCKDLMLNFRTGNFGKVRLADDETLDIAGMGDINLRTSLGTSWTLKDVRYILRLKKMLISVGQLDKEGYRVTFGDGKWKVIKGNLVVARGEKRGTLYIVEQSIYEVNVVANEIDSSTLWHQRVGHMIQKGMKLVSVSHVFLEIRKELLS